MKPDDLKRHIDSTPFQEADLKPPRYELWWEPMNYPEAPIVHLWSGKSISDARRAVRALLKRESGRALLFAR